MNVVAREGGDDEGLYKFGDARGEDWIGLDWSRHGNSGGGRLDGCEFRRLNWLCFVSSMVLASTCSSSSSTGRKTNYWRLNPGRGKK